MTIAAVTMYLLMLVFDLCLLAGTAFLVAERGWSGWWFILTVIMCAGSNPKYLIKAMGYSK